ncbi:hypothetical protein NW768_004829 [Fusarium equiseti]|uniref:Uncharacterized protein n=1 Tax=Fusarium equiseti TaxID=61235 RepID=A0ABQ8RHB9_FUSEQ|nr:hypothetical protein NW768_004829 [Fusarium equiseti]
MASNGKNPSSSPAAIPGAASMSSQVGDEKSPVMKKLAVLQKAAADAHRAAAVAERRFQEAKDAIVASLVAEKSLAMDKVFDVMLAKAEEDRKERDANIAREALDGKRPEDKTSSSNDEGRANDLPIQRQATSGSACYQRPSTSQRSSTTLFVDYPTCHQGHPTKSSLSCHHLHANQELWTRDCDRQMGIYAEVNCLATQDAADPAQPLNSQLTPLSPINVGSVHNKPI